MRFCGVLGSSGLAVCLAGCVAQIDMLGEPGGDAGSELHEIELFADDPLRQAADLEGGAYGAVLQDGEVRNRNSQLDFGRLNPGGFTCGVQGNEVGHMVDLGTDQALGEALGKSSGFAALTLSGGRFGYAAADAIFDDATVDDAPVAQAHVYALRIHRDAGDLIVKLLVADLTSPTRVVIDWVVLE